MFFCYLFLLFFGGKDYLVIIGGSCGHTGNDFTGCVGSTTLIEGRCGQNMSECTDDFTGYVSVYRE